jgi:hypothetical protein
MHVTDEDTRQWANARDRRPGEEDKKKVRELKKLWKQLPHKKSVDWRVDKPINNGLKTYLIAKKIRSLGYEPDLFDIRAHIDGTLSYEENVETVLETYHLSDPGSGLYMDLSEEESEKINFERHVEYICERTGRNREDVEAEILLAKQKEADLERAAQELQKQENEALFYSDIYNFNCSREYAIYKKFEGSSPLRVSNVFMPPVVANLVKLINIKTEAKIKSDRAKNIDSRGENPFVESGFLHYAMSGNALYEFNTDLCFLREAEQVYSEIINCFAPDPRIPFAEQFSVVRQNILNGGSNDVFWLQVPPQLKREIRRLSDEFIIYDTDVGYFILIYSLPMLYRNKYFADAADGYENSHYYTKGEIKYNLQRQIYLYTKRMIDHLVATLPILQEQLAIKTLLLEHGYKVHPDNIRFKKLVIEHIKRISSWFADPTYGNSFATQVSPCIEQIRQEPVTHPDNTLADFAAAPDLDAEQLGHQTTTKEVMHQSSSQFNELIRTEILTLEDLAYDIKLDEYLKTQEPKGQFDELIKNQILTLEDLSNDIKLDGWLKLSGCPICMSGNVADMICDSCGWQYEENVVSA